MSLAPEPGTILAGNFRVDRVLGIGGMGCVVAAHHLRLDPQVALNFLLPEALGNRDIVARNSIARRRTVEMP